MSIYLYIIGFGAIEAGKNHGKKLPKYANVPQYVATTAMGEPDFASNSWVAGFLRRSSQFRIIRIST
jgi:hypothetical protein